MRYNYSVDFWHCHAIFYLLYANFCGGVIILKAEFGIMRERNNKLFYKEYMNDKGIFHFHSQIELYFVDEGEMEIYVNNKRRLVKKGEMSVALSYDAHSYRTPDFSRSSVFIIPLYMCEEFIKAIEHKRVTNPFITDSEVVSKIKSLVKEIDLTSTNEIKLTGYIYLILGLVMENIGFQNTHDSHDPDLSSRILFYINENFKKEISLASLSAEFGYSESYLSRYFKSYFNISLNQYITIIRLKNALMLMHEKKNTLTYCAFESGFGSMRTFYRVFSEEFGCSPKEYLRKM